MKTTVEITDELLLATRRVAAERGETMRSVLEEALRRFLDDLRRAEPAPEAYRFPVVDGDGLVKGVGGSTWLELSYSASPS